MTNALLIYNQLRASGLSDAGALGLMGNWMAESGLEPNRVQGDFSQGRLQSTAYTDDLKKGRLGRAQFARDQKGYGLAQWTAGDRKAGMMAFHRKCGASIGDFRTQVDWLLQEIRNYSYAWRTVVTSNNPYESLAFMLCCDDTERENGNIAKAEKMVLLCDEFGWIPVSMANDWSTIYGEGVTRK